MLTEGCECGVRFAIGLMRCPRCGKIAPRFAKFASPQPVMDPLGPLAELPFKQLRAMAKAAGLSGAGKAPELAARLAEHRRAQAAAQGGETP